MYSQDIPKPWYYRMWQQEVPSVFHLQDSETQDRYRYSDGFRYWPVLNPTLCKFCSRTTCKHNSPQQSLPDTRPWMFMTFPRMFLVLELRRSVIFSTFWCTWRRCWIAENIFPNPSRFRALGLEDRDGRTGFVCRPPNHGFTTLGASTHELMVSGP
jgi:hypothetical protein